MDEGLDLRGRIQRNYQGLRPSEQLVADYLHGMSGQRLDQSITDFARVVGVSEATVSRFTRALGFNGYSDMKLSLAAASNSNHVFPNIPAELHWTDSVSEIARKLSGVLAASLTDTEKQLDCAHLDQAVGAILAAKRVVFVGVGGAAAICEEAAHIFLKIGIEATSYSDGYTQTVVASTLRPDCLLVAISHTGVTPTVVSAVEMARANGVTTIGITGSVSSPLANAAELVFVTTQRASTEIPLHGDFLEGRICQLFLIDVLYLGVMFRLDAVARGNLLTTTNALAKHFTAPPESLANAAGGAEGRRRRGSRRTTTKTGANPIASS